MDVDMESDMDIDDMSQSGDEGDSQISNPASLEYRFILRFPNENGQEYIVNQDKATIGRGEGNRLFRLSQDPGRDGPVDSDASHSSSLKRKRDLIDVDGDEGSHEKFLGGLAGPLSQRTFQEIDHASDDGERINIYPPSDADGNLVDLKGISRKHIRIEWDYNAGYWTAHTLGRNGMYINDHFFSVGETADLQHGDEISLKGVRIFFLLHEEDFEDEEEEDEDEEGLEDLQSSDDDEVSSDEQLVDLDDGADMDMDDGIILEQTKTRPVAAKKIRLNVTPKTKNGKRPYNRKAHASIEGPDQGTSADTKRSTKADKKVPSSGKKPKTPKARKASDTERLKEEGDQSGDDAADADPVVDGPPKKRGPGRPPADGVMSKKKRKDEERAKRLGLSSVDELPSKAYSKPRKDKDAGAESADGPKKKKTKRADGEDSGEESPGSASKKKRRTPEPAKPPPNRDDYTEEQLQKPEETYAQLLYKILSEKEEAMTLPQIYETFETRWPYYKFQDSLGWQSSIRHNLQSTPCIVKAGKEGKGHKWKLDPDIPFESKTTKKVAQPRPMLYPNQQTMNGGQGQMPGLPGQQAYMGGQGYYQQYQAKPNGASSSGAHPYGQGFPNGQQQSSMPGNPFGGQQMQPGVGPHYPGQQSQAGGPSQGNHPNARLQGPGGPMPQQGMGQQHYPGPNGQMPQHGGVGPSKAGVPPPPNPHGQIGPAEIAARRLKVFESFKVSFMKTAGNEETANRYSNLIRDATNWLMNHPNSVGYSGAPGDVATVVLQMQNSWKRHATNPVNSATAANTPQAQSPAAVAANSAAAQLTNSGNAPGVPGQPKQMQPGTGMMQKQPFKAQQMSTQPMMAQQSVVAAQVGPSSQLKAQHQSSTQQKFQAPNFAGGPQKATAGPATAAGYPTASGPGTSAGHGTGVGIHTAAGPPKVTGPSPATAPLTAPAPSAAPGPSAQSAAPASGPATAPPNAPSSSGARS